MTYEMLTGEPPFTGLNSQAIVAKVLTETPPPLRPKRPTVSPAVEHAVLTALQKLPADRYGTREGLRRGARRQGRLRSDAGDGRDAPLRAPLALTGPVMVAASALLAAAAAGAIGWFLHRAPVLPSAATPRYFRRTRRSPTPVGPASRFRPMGHDSYTSGRGPDGPQLWLRNQDQLRRRADSRNRPRDGSVLLARRLAGRLHPRGKYRDTGGHPHRGAAHRGRRLRHRRRWCHLERGRLHLLRRAHRRRHHRAGACCTWWWQAHRAGHYRRHREGPAGSLLARCAAEGSRRALHYPDAGERSRETNWRCWTRRR